MFDKKRIIILATFICILVFLLSVGIGVYSKMKIQPSWAKNQVILI